MSRVRAAADLCVDASACTVGDPAALLAALGIPVGSASGYYLNSVHCAVSFRADALACLLGSLAVLRWLLFS